MSVSDKIRKDFNEKIIIPINNKIKNPIMLNKTTYEWIQEILLKYIELKDEKYSTKDKLNVKNIINKNNIKYTFSDKSYRTWAELSETDKDMLIQVLNLVISNGVMTKEEIENNLLMILANLGIDFSTPGQVVLKKPDKFNMIEYTGSDLNNKIIEDVEKKMISTPDDYNKTALLISTMLFNYPYYGYAKDNNEFNNNLKEINNNIKNYCNIPVFFNFCKLSKLVSLAWMTGQNDEGFFNNKVPTDSNIYYKYFLLNIQNYITKNFYQYCCNISENIYTKLFNIGDNYNTKIILNNLYPKRRQIQKICETFIENSKECNNDKVFKKLFDKFSSTFTNNFWKLLYSISGKNFSNNYSIKFLPSNYQLFYDDYEIQIAIKVALNSFFYYYGNFSYNITSEPDLTKPSINDERQNFGKCYNIDDYPIKYNENIWDCKTLKKPTEIEIKTNELSNYLNKIDSCDNIISVKLNDNQYIKKWENPSKYITAIIWRDTIPFSKNITMTQLSSDYYRFVGKSFENTYLNELIDEYKISIQNNLLNNINNAFFTFADYLTARSEIDGALVQGLSYFLYKKIIVETLKWNIIIPVNSIASFGYINYQHIIHQQNSNDYNDKFELNENINWDKFMLPHYTLIENKYINDFVDDSEKINIPEIKIDKQINTKININEQNVKYDFVEK